MDERRGGDDDDDDDDKEEWGSVCGNRVDKAADRHQGGGEHDCVYDHGDDEVDANSDDGWYFGVGGRLADPGGWWTSEEGGEGSSPEGGGILRGADVYGWPRARRHHWRGGGGRPYLTGCYTWPVMWMRLGGDQRAATRKLRQARKEAGSRPTKPLRPVASPHV